MTVPGHQAFGPRWESYTAVERLRRLTAAEIAAAPAAALELNLDVLGWGNPLRWTRQQREDVRAAYEAKIPALALQTLYIHNTLINALLPRELYGAFSGGVIETARFRTVEEKKQFLLRHVTLRQMRDIWDRPGTPTYDPRMHEAARVYLRSMTRGEQDLRALPHAAAGLDVVVGHLYPASFATWLPGHLPREPVASSYREKGFWGAVRKAATSLHYRTLLLIEGDAALQPAARRDLARKPVREWPREEREYLFTHARPRDVSGMTVLFPEERTAGDDTIGHALHFVLEHPAFLRYFTIVSDPRSPRKRKKLAREKIVLQGKGMHLPGGYSQGIRVASKDCTEIIFAGFGSYCSREISDRPLQETDEHRAVTVGVDRSLFARERTRVRREPGNVYDFRSEQQDVLKRLEDLFSP